jgi:hypothetical protein
MEITVELVKIELFIETCQSDILKQRNTVKCCKTELPVDL